MSHPLSLRVAGVRRKARQVLWAHGLAWVIGAFFLAALLVGVGDYLIRFEDRGLRILGSLFVVGLAAWAAIRHLAPIWRTPLDDVRVAKKIERRFPAFSDRLATTIQFLGSAEGDPQAGSLALRRAVIHQTTADAQALNFDDAIDSRPALRVLAAALAVTLVCGLLTILNPRAAWLATVRMGNPFGAAAWPKDNHLAFADPPARIASGGAFEVKLVDQFQAPLPDEVRIQFRYLGPDDDVTEETERMQFANGAMVARRENVTRPFEYRAEGGDDRSMPWHRLEVVEPPMIESLEIALHSPDYTALPIAPSERNIRALSGTRVAFRGTTSKRLVSAAIVHEKGPPVPAGIADDGYGFSLAADAATPFTVLESGAYWFELVDSEGVTGGSANRYEIKAIADAAPTVLIEEPTGNLFVTATAIVPIEILAKDDLAIREIALRYSRPDKSDQGELLIPLYLGPERAIVASGPDGAILRGENRNAEFAWDLGQEGEPWSGLAPGMTLRFDAVAVDYVPQPGASTPRQITIITHAELESRLAERQSMILGELARFLKLERESRSATKGVEIQLDRVGSLAKADHDQLQLAELTQREVDRGLAGPDDGVPAQIAGLLADLDQNRLDAPEVRRQMEGLSAELARLAEGPLPTVRRELTAALKAAQAAPIAGEAPGDRDAPKEGEAPAEPPPADPAVETSLAEAGKGQDEVIASLEELLGQLSQWDSFRRVARDVAQLARDQGELARDSDELGRETVARDVADLTEQQRADLKKLGERQRDLAHRFDDVARTMETIQSDLEAGDPLAAETLGDAIDHATRQTIGGRMTQAAERLEQNQMGQAGQDQTQAAADLNEMLDILANRQEQELARLVEKLREAETELEGLRKRQDGLRKQIAEATQNPDEAARKRELERLAREERQLEEEVARLARRLQRLRAENAGRAASRAAASLGQAGQDGESGDGDSASQNAEQAQQDLDEAQDELAERRRQAEADLAMEQLARMEDALKSLAERQRGVIDETQRLEGVKQQSGELTRGQRSSVQGLGNAETAIGQETNALAEKLTGAPVFKLALESASGQLSRAAELLLTKPDPQTGEETQTAERRALRRFEQLLEAVAENGKSGEGQPQDGEGGGQQPGDKVRALAEIRMLKLLQQDLYERLTVLDEAKGDNQALTPEQERELESLSREQGELADLAIEFLQPEPDAEAMPPDDPLGEDLETEGEGEAQREGEPQREGEAPAEPELRATEPTEPTTDPTLP